MFLSHVVLGLIMHHQRCALILQDYVGQMEIKTVVRHVETEGDISYSMYVSFVVLICT